MNQEELQKQLLEARAKQLQQQMEAAEFAKRCRVYAGSLHFDLTEADVRVAFTPFGPIKSIQLGWDNITQKSKGYAFIEYTEPAHAESAIAIMNGRMLAGRQIKVGRPTSGGGLGSLPVGMGLLGQPLQTVMPGGIPGIQQLVPGVTTNGLALTPQPGAAGTPSFGPPTTLPMLPPRVLTLPSAQPQLMQTVQSAAPANRIYVGSIYWDVTADDLKQAFQVFGPIKSITLMPNPETGKHKGFGFIEYETAEAAELAIQHMNGKEIAGRPLKVNHAVTTSQQPLDLFGAASANTAAAGPNAMALAALKALGVLSPAMFGNPGFVNIPGVPSPVPATAATLAAAGLLAGQPNLAAAAATAAAAASAAIPALPPAPQEESLAKEESVTINQQQRVQLMQKLARMGEASRCIVLRNMVSAEDLDDDLENDVTTECSKYGLVERVVIYQEHEQNTSNVTVKIFILFSQAAEADKATRSLNGRWFGGRQIRAELFPMEKFNIQDYSG